MRIDYQPVLITGGLQVTAFLVVNRGRRIQQGTMDFIAPNRPALTAAMAAELSTNPLLT